MTSQPTDQPTEQATEQPTELARPAEPFPAPPAHPPLFPPAPPLPAPEPVPAVKKDRRVLRAALRWTAAVVVFAAVGAGVAYGVTEQRRSDLPGLATESDGRWEYPEIVRPPLPKDAPAAFAEDNLREEHFADLRELVLPAPDGAEEDKALAGKDGWLPTATYLKAYDKDARGDLAQALKDGGLRHVAARGWTMPDGTRTSIYLLRFNTSAFAREYRDQVNTSLATVVGAPKFDEDFSLQGNADAVPDTHLFVYGEQKPYGRERVRYAYVEAGDVLALVVQSDDGHGSAVPFRQTLALQNQLLG
ncbi:hypothetical protein ABII15_20815 [Streptomyces sp. HUAS MG91]|uniref:Uncharacterized protein n=1 Tax=Streptomyces tabacisoli TaxID=3156398 RepID=A0AAU8IWL9_9ACTN